MSDAEIKNAVKLFLRKQETAPQEIKLLNLPKFPEIPEFPEPIDYTAILKDILKNLSKEKKPEFLNEIKELNKSFSLLSLKIEQQTSALVEAMTMQADVMAELVVAYREPKKIIRDSMGRPEGIE
jgi:ABC-type ATPase with predicted acetyltransferase domain